MEEYKKETSLSYNRSPGFYEKKFKDNFEQYALPDVKRFISELKGPKLLDIGCGPGIYLDYFRENGVDALGIDLSDPFLEICFSKGLNVRKMDAENPLLYPYSFDGIWASAVLLHIPRDRVPQTIRVWAKLLKPNGLLWIGVKQGEGEGFEPSETRDDTKRYFTYFTEGEIKSLFSEKFDIVHGYLQEVEDGRVWIKYLFRLKSK